ncbi:fungal-specific transcription factor domain-containing protein [Ilyonectria destructans]|nr:fungal-specific transcription factor domain-containing protein [Ilyonectria destructans]
MVRSTRSSYACARCYRRKKKCDRGYPSCSQCTSAKARCIGLDRGSEAELPRSLVSYLEELVAQLELERESLLKDRESSGVTIPQREQVYTAISPLAPVVASPEEVAAAYSFAAITAKNSAPAASFDSVSRYPLPYCRAFFLSAELPFPLAFQEQRPMNVPSSHGGGHPTQLPEEVAEKLMAVYIGQILPQYPLFLKDDISDMFERFKMSGGSLETVTADEQFIISMIMAIAALSSGARDYRKLVSVAESLRRDAFTHLDFGLSSNNATTTTIQQLLLLAQYGYLFPSSTNLWQVVGDAARIALELGLHQETPVASGIDQRAADFRKRLYWTLYSIERSVAITSHRPFAVAGDQVHLPFPLFQDDPNFSNQSPDQNSDQRFDQVSYIRSIDRLRFLRLQSEICSVNIGMRPISNPQLTHGGWLVDVERQISEAKVNSATPKWCDFMEWHAILLLHMPCALNPSPDEASVLKYFDAAIRITDGYWELVEANNLDHPWHATHHCYEAGNLILYGLWHYRALIRRYYSLAQVFEVVHRISGFFILIVKQWPAAQRCGALFDQLRKGALSFFREEESSDSEPCLEARQLKELVFRENADVLYAREQPSATIGQSTFETMFPEFEIDQLSLDTDMDFLGLFNLSEAPDLEGFGQTIIQGESEQSDLPGTPLVAESENSTVPNQQAKVVIEEAQLQTVMQNLPVCSHCKKRRIRCDMSLPACYNCAKLRRDCCYWDNALAEETSRRHVHALKQHVESLMTEVDGLSHPFEPAATVSDLLADTSPSNVARSGTGINERVQRHILSNILCPAPSNSTSSPNLMFFGATSSFSLLANSLGRSIPLPREASTPESRPPILLETLCSSLMLNMAVNISQSEAQNLAWHYYRSIEITYPILGQTLISQTLDHIYSGSSVESDDNVVQTRLNLILAISLASLGLQDQRLQVFADTYFRDAVSGGLSSDLFIHPTNQSLQMILLLCIYAWIRPSAMDVWRLLGHASRMCLDIIEVHGSDKTDSAYAGVLYRTLYTLETQVSISFGRPHQLPDGHEVLAYSPDLSSVATGELSTMVYNLARLQNRFHRDVIGTDWVSPVQEFVDPAIDSAPWMATCVHDIKIWLDDWNARIDTLFDQSPAPQREDDMNMPLRSYGEFLQCEALLLAKTATDRRGQLLISSEEELAICTQLLQAVNKLRETSALPTGVSLPYTLEFVFPLTWTRTHAIFTATTILLQHMHNASVTDGEVQRLFQAGLEMLASLQHTGDQSMAGLVNCIQQMFKSSHVSKIV